MCDSISCDVLAPIFRKTAEVKMGITIFKIFISGGVSSDTRSEITVYGFTLCLLASSADNFVNSLDPYQTTQNLGPDLDLNSSLL